MGMAELGVRASQDNWTVVWQLSERIDRVSGAPVQTANCESCAVIMRGEDPRLLPGRGTLLMAWPGHSWKCSVWIFINKKQKYVVYSHDSRKHNIYYYPLEEKCIIKNAVILPLCFKDWEIITLKEYTIWNAEIKIVNGGQRSQTKLFFGIQKISCIWRLVRLIETYNIKYNDSLLFSKVR